MTVGRGAVEKIIGEKLNGEPLDDPNAGKNPAAVALGKLGGAKGGVARAAALSPRKRKAIATSYIERANLTMRMGMRRFTRLTNGFSKKIDNHAAAVALFFMYYNFARVHKTLRCSSAMAAGVDSRLWELKDVVEMIAAYEKSN